MTTYPASCRCGQLTATAAGEPTRISVCHCLNCQKRSGSAFAAQVRFPVEQVTIAGQSNTFTATGDNGRAHFHFCPDCGSTVYYANDSLPDTIAIALGAVRRSLFHDAQLLGVGGAAARMGRDRRRHRAFRISKATTNPVLQLSKCA